MDNLTHALAGAWIAEALHRGSRPLSPDETKSRRLLYLTASILANNAPDFDLVLSPLLPSPLGYLLHHRGHTHTVGFIPAQILLVFALLFCVPRFRKLLLGDKAARLGVALLSLIGLCAHLALDSLNSYGVHPFWPLDSSWYYGDLVFIIEPALWASFGIPVLFLADSLRVRAVLMGILVFVPLAAHLAGLLPLVNVAIALSLVTLLVVIARTRSSGVSLIAGLLAALSFLAVQAAGQIAVTREIRAQYAAQGSHEVDLILSPLPTNPLCWGYIRIAVDKDGASYVIDRGAASAKPRVLKSESCPQLPEARAETGTRLANARRGSLSELKTLAETDCWFDAWLRFARAPVIEATRASDLRFGGGTVNFTALPLVANGKRECPGWIPKWRKPRGDLLGE